MASSREMESYLCLGNRFIDRLSKGSRKKSFFCGPATKRGGGKGRATKKKNYFLSSKKKIPEKLCGH